MAMQRVMNAATGKKLGDRPVGRLPKEIDPEERIIVIRDGQSVGKTDKPMGRLDRAVGYVGPFVPLGGTPMANTAISPAPRNMMEGPAASLIQAPMNRAARRKAARQRTK